MMLNEIQKILNNCIDNNSKILKRRSIETKQLPKEFAITELKKQIQNDRIEKNLKVLKLLSNNDPSINEEQKRELLNTYSGWGGLRDAIYTPHI